MTEPDPKRPKVCVHSFIVFPIHKFFLFLDGSSGDESTDGSTDGSSEGASGTASKGDGENEEGDI